MATALATSLPLSPGDPVKPAPRPANIADMVPSRLRADLIMQKQTFRHEEFFVLKDPLALTYFRLRPEEAFILSQLDGRKTLRQLATNFASHYPNKSLGVEEIAFFLHQLGQTGLLNISARRFVDFARQKPTTSQNMLLIWAKLISGMIFFKIPLFDPSPWLGRLTHAVRFFWNQWVVIACLAFVAWTAFWLYLHAGAFQFNTVSFLAPGNLVLLWLSVIIIKTLHEFAHATTCRHFGCEVHEMGACLICFTPCGYVDASDAWMMRHRRHKIYTAMAGIYIEFIIAAIAAHVWLSSPQGLLQNLAFNAMLVASVNTLFFNMNPLMKFDGYYVVSDLMEVPNLRTKAMAYCSLKLQRFLLGTSNSLQEKIVENDHHGRLFVLYAICAFGYMTFLIYSLSQIFARVLKPYGMGEFGLALGVFVQGSFLMLPLFKFFSDSLASRTHITQLPEARRRLPFHYLVIVLLLLGLLFIPTHYFVTGQGLVLFEEGRQVGSRTGGFIDHVAVESGQDVNRGQLLLELSNPEVVNRLQNAELDVAAGRLRLGQLQSSLGQAGSRQLVEASRALESAQIGLQRAREDMDALVIRSPISGRVVGPVLQRAPGLFLPANISLLRVVDDHKLRVVVPLTEKEVELVRVGSKVTGRWQADGRSLHTVISNLPTRRARREDYLAGMFAMHGGPAPAEASGGPNDDPNFPLFLAEATIDRPADLLVVEGMRVRVSIEGGRTTLVRKWWREIVSFWGRKLQTFR